MKGLIQRVRQARVEVAGEVVGAIDQGLLVLVGVEREDDQARADKLLHKLLHQYNQLHLMSYQLK